jgi:hypothetical protein
MEPTLGTIKTLATTFGNTQTSTLWRFAETAHANRALVGIVCGHPRRPVGDFDPQNPCKYVIESNAFRGHFAGISEVELYRIIRSYCSWNKGGPLGKTETLIPDVNGELHVFRFETFSNTYDALTLGVHLRPHAPQVAVA